MGRDIMLLTTHPDSYSAGPGAREKLRLLLEAHPELREFVHDDEPTRVEYAVRLPDGRLAAAALTLGAAERPADEWWTRTRSSAEDLIDSFVDAAVSLGIDNYQPVLVSRVVRISYGPSKLVAS
ncbi:hypothetical protein SEA_MOLLYMUR_92 [Gordonia phage Mollymur]|uniref:Uncharacterized protein n=1 Tax=Gordonia phage Mollymur TaxID=2590895 RepID=A0A4Y6EBK0_9CAUD|nr:hypothetical protein PQB84_gp034 [Gordonia phage Mollymur]QDF15452.1 hypothetical protein SEA_MOLLYMUR_92 [Gordonia phage Mollymur]